MATLQKRWVVDAPATRVWAAFADFGAVHTRVAPGFVLQCTREGDVRTVQFLNGTSAKEQLITLDDQARRLVYAVSSERVKHYNAVIEVHGEANQRSAVSWTIDFFPHDLAFYLDTQMTAAVKVMQTALAR